MQRFILELLEKDEVILIKGNHEDLALDLLNDPKKYLWDMETAIFSHHYRNRTMDTFKTDISVNQFIGNVHLYPQIKHKEMYCAVLHNILYTLSVNYCNRRDYVRRKYAPKPGYCVCQMCKKAKQLNYIEVNNIEKYPRYYWEVLSFLEKLIHLAYNILKSHNHYGYQNYPAMFQCHQPIIKGENILIKR